MPAWRSAASGAGAGAGAAEAEASAGAAGGGAGRRLRAAPGVGEGAGRDLPLEEHGRADDAHVARVAHPAGVGVADAREAERRHRRVAQAEAVHHDLAVRRDDVAALAERGRPPVHDVASVDRDDDLGAARGAVANADLVAVAEAAEDERPAAVVKGRQDGAAGVEELERERARAGGGGVGAREGRIGAGGEDGEGEGGEAHGEAPFPHANGRRPEGICPAGAGRRLTRGWAGNP